MRIPLISKTAFFFSSGIVTMFWMASAIEHFRNPWWFLNSILRYEILPGELAAATAALLPVLQSTLAIVIIFERRSGVGLLISCLLFTAFGAVQTSSWIHGMNISCGCFGTFSEPISLRTIFADVFLATISFLGFLSCRLNKKR